MLYYGLLQGMLLLLGARGVVVATCTSHVLLFIRDRVFVWLLVCCCCLVEQFIEFGLHPQELHLSRSMRSEFLHGWCQKWDLLVAYLPRPTLRTEANSYLVLHDDVLWMGIYTQ